MTTPAPDLSTWLTKQQAADRIIVSTKTVEKLAAEGELQSAQRKNAGSPPIAVYHPGDVEKVAKARNPGPGAFVVPRGSSSVLVSEVSDGFEKELLRPLGELYQSAAEALREAFSKPTDRLFLTLKEAARLTGLTQRYLKNRIEAQTLDVIRDGNRLRIRRKDLEDL